MIFQYVVLGYADLATDILVLVELMTINIPIAVLNLFFFLHGIILGYWNSDRTPKDLLLNVSQLSILVDGIETLNQGKQTPGLVLDKKMDAIVRSMPSVILRLFSFLKDLDDLLQTNSSYPFSMIVQMFCNAKRRELIEIFNEGAPQEKNKFIQIMSRIDPANASAYRAVR